VVTRHYHPGRHHPRLLWTHGLPRVEVIEFLAENIEATPNQAFALLERQLFQVLMSVAVGHDFVPALFQLIPEPKIAQGELADIRVVRGTHGNHVFASGELEFLVDLGCTQKACPEHVLMGASQLLRTVRCDSMAISRKHMTS
jgi:hypothetical protein